MNGIKVKSVCISEKKGTTKHPVDSIVLIENYGIEGDAHAGNWHRQVSLLNVSSVEKLQKKLDFKLEPGAFAENILIDGDICLYELPVETKIKIADAILEVTQIGKECHESCEIRKLTGDCVMPREGIFAKVLSGGTVKTGDLVEIVDR